MSSYEIIGKGRKQLIDILQKDIDCVLDELRVETVITKEEYEGLEKIEDSKKKSRELLILIQQKGESACCQFLEWLEVTCPASKYALQVHKHGCSVGEEEGEIQKHSEEEKMDLEKGCPSQEKEDDVQEESEEENQHPITDHLNLRKDLHVPDSVEFSGERSGSNSMDLARSGNQDAPRSQEGVGEVETISSPVSSEAGSGSQSPDDAIMLPGGGSSTEDPDDASLLLSNKEREVKTPDSPDVAENPSDAAMCTENGGRDEDLESSASPWVGSGAESPSAPPSSSEGSGASDGNCGKSEGTGSGTQIPGISASKGEEEGAQQLDGSRKKRTSRSPARRERFENETTIKGSMDSVMVSGGEIIRKARKQLIEILQKDLELVLDELFSQSVITEEEYEALDKTEEDSKKKIRKLLIMIQKMGEIACDKFLECFEIVCPGSIQVLQNSVHERLPPEEKTERVLGETEEAVPKAPAIGTEI